MNTRSGRRNLFIKGAYLTTLSEEEELSEKEFIEKAGGIEKLQKFSMFSFVTLVLDDPANPFLVGHYNGRTIELALQGYGHKKWQTMEWRN